MEEDSGYTFAQDQPPTFMHLEGSGLMEKIEQLVRSGRLAPCGAMFSEPEGNMPSGESFVRQIMLTKRYFQNRFGVTPVSGWNLDSFSGHCWSLPQILSKSGIKHYTFANWANLIEDVEFWWEGPDGSRVLAYHLPCHYDSAQMMDHDKILNNFFGYLSRSKFNEFLFLDGDDLTPPARESIQGMKWFKSLRVAPSFEFTTPRTFFDSLDRKDLSSLPVFRGELVQHLDPDGKNNVGSYTTHCDVKQRNRLCESLLITAEKLGSIATLLGGVYPREKMRDAWQKVLRNQMHDILPGTAIHEAYEEAHRAFDEAEEAAREVISSSLSRIGSKIDTRGRGLPIVVFNPLCWKRDDIAELVVTVEQSYSRPVVLGPDGEEVPSQVVQDTHGTYDKVNRTVRLIFLARGVPALGYKLYRLLWRREPAEDTGIDVDTELSNEYLEATVDPETGLLTSLKSRGREFLGEGSGLLVEVYRDRGNPWHINLVGESTELRDADLVQVVEKGPVRKTIRVLRKMGSSRVEELISLSRGVPRLLCRVSVDCGETGLLFKISVPVPSEPARVTYEIPFAAIERKETGIDRPALRWTDVSGQGCGISLLNDGRYGYDVRDGRLRITLLRNPKAHLSRTGTDTGRRVTTVALYPHEGDWRSGTVCQGLELNNPLICRIETEHPGELPSELSFLGVSAEGAMVSCLKPAEETDDLILRIYDSTGRGVPEVGFNGALSWRRIEEVAMSEDEDLGRIELPFSMSPYEVKTLRLQRPSLQPLQNQ